MATAIYYYSLTGNVKKMAEDLSFETRTDLCEVTEVKKRSKFTAFFPGVFQAGGLKSSAINPLSKDMARFDDIVIMGPIWAGHPAPAVNSIIGLLPEGKTVSLICVSAGGEGTLAKTAALIEARGCSVKETRCLKKGTNINEPAAQ